MTFALGIDTGGTYTDAALVDHASGRVVCAAKSLTTRRDLSPIKRSARYASHTDHPLYASARSNRRSYSARTRSTTCCRYSGDSE